MQELHKDAIKCMLCFGVQHVFSCSGHIIFFPYAIHNWNWYFVIGIGIGILEVDLELELI